MRATISRLVGFGLILAATTPGSALADEATPAKKDSIAFLKPKEVALSTSVTPDRARPGETVTFRVTAKIQRPWHIYTFSETQPEEGPRHTQFDFFDTAGLKVAGLWTASKQPITKKEPAFPDLEKVSYFEDEVTWSVPLTVPPATEPGPKTLRVQVAFQICNEASCKPPARSTAPPATLTVLGADATATTTSAQPAKPDRANNPPQVKFTTAIEPAEARAGDRVTYKVTAKLDPSWHIFAVKPEDGEWTQFELFDLGGLKVLGDWTASKPPIVKPDANAAIPRMLEYFEDEVTWALPLQVPADTAPGSKRVETQAQFQVCSETTCTFGRATLPAATFTILPGAPPVAIAAAAPAPPAVVAPAPPASVAAAPPAAANAVEASLQQGIIPFLLLSAGAGLLALVMPCVWPMVPITVNFFVKQGQAQDKARRKSTTGLAITYCLSIIGIFTLVGLLFSAVFGATAAQNLATSPWLNLFVAALFVMFGLSLLGVFEFRLPSFLLNASAQGEGRGGLIGVVFMALTLTITSFTCTFPVVGALLVMAARGSVLYPVIGLATFATVLALPFFLLALAPGLLSKLPKSGDWMNAVKVVGGLLEIGAAFKFLNNAEIGFGTIAADAWTNAPAVLTLWIVLILVCGIYLLGLFRTDHDHDAVKVGPGRILVGSLFVFLGLYLTPALFGRPPQGQIWDRLIVGLLPPDVESLEAPVVAVGGKEAAGTVLATSADPTEATRQQKHLHGVPWGLSFEAALEQAKAEGRPVLIDFTGVFCANCRQMEKSVMPRDEVKRVLEQFVTVQLYTDQVPIKSITPDDREALAAVNQDRQVKLVRDQSTPLYVVLTPQGEVVASKAGFIEPPLFVDFLQQALAKAKPDGAAVARAEVAGGR